MVTDYEGLCNHAKESALHPQGSGKLLSVVKNRVTWLVFYSENIILAAL